MIPVEKAVDDLRCTYSFFEEHKDVVFERKCVQYELSGYTYRSSGQLQLHFENFKNGSGTLHTVMVHVDESISEALHRYGITVVQQKDEKDELIEMLEEVLSLLKQS